MKNKTDIILDNILYMLAKQDEINGLTLKRLNRIDKILNNIEGKKWIIKKPLILHQNFSCGL